MRETNVESAGWFLNWGLLSSIGFGLVWLKRYLNFMTALTISSSILEVVLSRTALGTSLSVGKLSEPLMFIHTL